MLRGLEMINVEWTAAAKKLRASLLHHIQEEEGKFFNQARAVLLDHEAEQMAVAFEEAKAKAQGQGDLRNMMDMIGNMMPKRFRRSEQGSQPQA